MVYVLKLRGEIPQRVLTVRHEAVFRLWPFSGNFLWISGDFTSITILVQASLETACCFVNYATLLQFFCFSVATFLIAITYCSDSLE